MTTKSRTQWRFAILFLVLGSPLLVWPWALNHLNDANIGIVFWIPLLTIHAVIPILDVLMGDDASQALTPEVSTSQINRWLPLVCLPAWYGALLTGAYIAAQSEISTLQLIGIIASLGAMGAVLAINPAHELIHRNSKLERTAGGILLAGVWYGAFKVEHVRGHHLHAATKNDTASAVLGQSIFNFVPRSIIGTIRNAHHLEAQKLQRLAIKKYSIAWFAKNEIVRWNLISLALSLMVVWAWGLIGLAVVLFASLGAILELEVINYIEHYGLRRKPLDQSNRFETVQEHHSWNTNTLATNMFLFNLQRHSDHHAHAGKDYLHLSSIPSAPQLPAGYSIMFLVALCPPLWRRVMDHRVPSQS
jgi:alkane 1-monooxygenase